MDYFLKAASQQDLDTALAAAGITRVITDENDAVVARIVKPAYALDVIGVTYAETDKVTTREDGSYAPVMAAQPGFFANLRGTLTADQEAVLPLIPAPKTPSRMWADAPAAVAVAAPAPASVTGSALLPITRLAFLNRFTTAERIAVRDAAKTNPVVEDFMDMISLAGFIDLGRTDTQLGVGYLAQQGYLTAERAQAILTDPIQSIEMPV
jgi:hypothetical protein